jgi:hypothetical protein
MGNCYHIFSKSAAIFFLAKAQKIVEQGLTTLYNEGTWWQSMNIEDMTLEQIKAAAEPKVKPEVWEWINGGTETEFTS